MVRKFRFRRSWKNSRCVGESLSETCHFGELRGFYVDVGVAGVSCLSHSWRVCFCQLWGVVSFFWIRGCVIRLMYLRRTQHTIHGHLPPPIKAVLWQGHLRFSFFCVAIDPLICALRDVCRCVRLTAYMDSKSTACEGLKRLAAAQKPFEFSRLRELLQTGKPSK